MTQIIVIVVSPSGKTQVATHGFTGSNCRDASRFIEEALGQAQSERLSSEFYQTNEQNTHHLEGRP